MTVPDFQSIMLPLLKCMGDGEEHNIQDLVDVMAAHFQLQDADLNEMLPSGKQPTFYNRVGWARTYLSKSGLLEPTRRGFYRITQRGREVLTSNPAKINKRLLEQFPEYKAFRSRKKPEQEQPNGREVQGEEPTPEEVLEDAYQEIRETLAQDLLATVKNCPPAFFERLVVEMLVKMGYGGSRREAARAVGQSGDGGIDGIIDEDRLGLDSIYLQAKRWESGTVGRPEIQKFVGALMGRHARRGIFITTSSFSADAVSFASSIDYKIVLIDGKRLADLMIDYGIGVTEVTSYQLKRIDNDYFSIG